MLPQKRSARRERQNVAKEAKKQERTNRLLDVVRDEGRLLREAMEKGRREMLSMLMDFRRPDYQPQAPMVRVPKNIVWEEKADVDTALAIYLPKN